MTEKVSITLIDIGFDPKPDKVLRKQYLLDSAVDAGRKLCEEYDYDTFKLQKVISSRKKVTK